jgi:hypothetical protein
MSADLEAATTVTSRMEAATLGKFCADGECRLVKVVITFTTFANGDWNIAFHRPSDPLNGESFNGENAGHLFKEIMESMAEVSSPPSQLADRVSSALVASLLVISIWMLCSLWPVTFAGHGLRGIVG